MTTAMLPDTTEVVELVIELTREAVAVLKDNPHDDCDFLQGYIGDLYVALGEIRPGFTELDMIVDEMMSRDVPAIRYVICDAKTRLALPNFPDVYSEPDASELARYGLIAIIGETYQQEEQTRQEALKAAREAAEAERLRAMPAHRIGITLPMYDALVEFAHANGRHWKATLRHQWENATTSETLQFLRNHPNFGPKGLAKFKLPTT